MKTIYFKSTTDGYNLPHIELAQPCKPCRPRWNVAIYQINNIPDEINWQEVKRIFEGTAIVSADNLVFNFNELGIGKIIMPKARKKEVHIDKNPKNSII